MFRLLPLLIVLLIAGTLAAQQQAAARPFARADSLAARIPVEQTKTPKSLAGWISLQVGSEAEKARILFTWIAANIAYDVQEKYAASNYYGDADISGRALATRKGVCMHYATLFCDVAAHLGITTYLVTGQTRQDGTLSPTGHAWVAARLDSAWQLLDPTWAAGSVDGTRFVKRYSPRWFMTPPAEMAATHLPFDPQWQLLAQPVSLTRFAIGKEVAGQTVGPFAYADSITRYLGQTEVQQAFLAARRMQESFRTDSSWPGDTAAKKPRLEEYHRHLLPLLLNQATDHYNSAVRTLNRYIAHKNKQFTPALPEAELRGYLSSVAVALDSSQALMNSMTDARNGLAADIQKQLSQVAEARRFLKDEQAFVDRYYATSPGNRMKLFYR